MSPANLSTGKAGKTPPSLPKSLAAISAICEKFCTAHGYKASLYGHFGHGCVHTRINFDLQSKDRHRQIPQVHGRSG